MYRHDIYRYGRYIEHEYKTVGRCGAKGEERQPKKNVTPEQMAKQNQWNREKTCLRIMRANFQEDDLWTTLKFPKGTEMTPELLKRIRKNFFDSLRREYKKLGQPLKYMYRIEIGELGGIHFHVLVNRLEGSTKTDALIKKLWGKYGHVHFTPLYEEGGFKALADYLVKPAKEEISGQLTLFGTEEEKKLFTQYNRSRNLVLPEPETHEYKRRTVRKLVEDGPEPEQGYYIIQDSIRYGVNPYTGGTYYYYTEVQLEPDTRDTWEERREKLRQWWRANVSTGKELGLARKTQPRQGGKRGDGR